MCLLHLLLTSSLFINREISVIFWACCINLELLDNSCIIILLRLKKKSPDTVIAESIGILYKICETSRKFSLLWKSCVRITVGSSFLPVQKEKEKKKRKEESLRPYANVHLVMFAFWYGNVLGMCFIIHCLFSWPQAPHL